MEKKVLMVSLAGTPDMHEWHCNVMITVAHYCSWDKQHCLLLRIPNCFTSTCGESKKKQHTHADYNT